MQIILRARQQHLVQEFRTKTTELTSKLIDDIHAAWKVYLRSEVNKGLLPSDQIQEGQEDQSWTALVERVKDGAWKQECLKRNEKFDMNLTAAVSTMCRIFCFFLHLFDFE